ncbi:chalcone isomerase family protein [Rhodoferax sp. BAB1]|uniref:chalcone isomerase family protein n=1 Tax=Rhodoferax sp. BAB1 TaxID=2741720 RepID=UPI001576BF0A|nr:chalcone isomerase family protein [Rhodoferax sp. BAB1]QKO21575.1 chalcone isomerase family protein [Rhodoferax sp. BAB1]
MSRILKALLLCTLGLLAWPVQAREVDGVKYEESIELAAAKLQLNGAGTRYKAVFKVYTAGLYLSRPASTTAEVLAAPGPKRLTLTFVREIASEELGRLFIKGIKSNTPNEEYTRIVGSVMRMSQVFYDARKMKVGEVINMDWVPGKGTVITIRGVPVGEPFPEPEFYGALLRIWLGQDAADWTLKEALLGQSSRR